MRKTAFAPGEYYHIYNRGNSKQKIFDDYADYTRFMKLLFLANGEANFKIHYINQKEDIYSVERGRQLVSIGAWVLMPNHFHLLISMTNEGSISKFMQKLTTGYSMYYNARYARTGGLFEGKFKAEHAGDDRYLKYLFSYIHLNPIKIINKNWKTGSTKDKEQELDFLEKYKYSSYLDCLGNSRPENKILNSESFPKYFPTKASFNREIFEWLSYNDPKL